MDDHKLDRLDGYLSDVRLAENDADRIVAAMRLANTARILEHEVIGDARATGVTWQQIGDIHQISRQGAYQRFTAHEALVRDLERAMSIDQ